MALQPLKQPVGARCASIGLAVIAQDTVQPNEAAGLVIPSAFFWAAKGTINRVKADYEPHGSASVNVKAGGSKRLRATSATIAS